MFDRLKTWLRGTPAPVVEVAPEPPKPPRVMKIDESSVRLGAARTPAGAGPYNRPAEEIYAPYKVDWGVNPEATLAMDSAVAPALDPGPLSQWAISSAFHEGQTFFGFPMLAELQQRVEYRNACAIWAEHVVRKWIRINGPEETVKAIEAEFDRLQVREAIQDTTFNDFAYGRGHIFFDFGDASRNEELTTPLAISPTKIGKNRPLKALKVVEPVWLYPGVYNTRNPLEPSFYEPREWIVYGRRVDATRLLTIVGNPVADMLKPAYAFAGLSLTQMIHAYVQNWLRSRQSVSDLIDRFSVLNLSTNMGNSLEGGDCSVIFQRAEFFNKTRSNGGIWVSDKDTEELQSLAVPLSGLEGLLSQAQEQIASAARIPLSIYLQITPTGLNATSDGETRNFYADVHSYQEAHMRDPLQAILDVVQLSLFEKIDPSVTFEFLPLWEMSDKDKADIRKSDADADAIYLTNGVVSPEETRERLAKDETSLYYAIDLTDPPPDQGNDGDGEENDGPFGNTEEQAQDASPFRAAGALIRVPNGRVLFVRRSHDASDYAGFWCFPGGKIDPGETPAQAAMRETFEEVGYSPTGGFDEPYFVQDGVAVYWHEASKEFRPTLNAEHVSYVWAEIGQAPQPLHPIVAAMIDRELNGA